MKTALKRLAHRLGYTITRLDARVEMDCPWGPNILLYALEDLARQSSTPLKIVQIGANDGTDQDPLQPFLQAHDCEAILIEPMDQPYALLEERYRSADKIRTLQAAISDRDTTMPMHYIVDGDGAPAFTLYSSFDSGTVEVNLASLKAEDPSLRDHRIQTKQLEAKTLSTVLQSYGMQDVDAVVVDAEGFDHRIVQGFLNEGVAPKVIRFEYSNLSRRDYNAVRDVLLEKNYEIARVGIDMYCQKEGLLR